MDKRYQVFVSSTYADLQDERQEVMQALLELDCIPAGPTFALSKAGSAFHLPREILMTRRFRVILALLAVLAAPVAAHADTITLTPYNGNGTDPNFHTYAQVGGGPFMATTSGTGSPAILPRCSPRSRPRA
jgi:hypothetical protein